MTAATMMTGGGSGGDNGDSDGGEIREDGHRHYPPGRPVRRVAATAQMIAAAAPEPFTPAIETVLEPQGLRVVCEGLRLPEGPVWMSDGSVLVVECEGGTLSRCRPDGTVEVVAELGGGPNGAAMGPDGRCYVANNGGFVWQTLPSGLRLPAGLGDYAGGLIQAVDLATGAVTDLYTHCDGQRLNSPNDLVFDDAGGFWFTDWGKPHPLWRTHGGLYYARADGSRIARVAGPMGSPNGVGLSPDGQTIYVSETAERRILKGRLTAPGQLDGEGLKLFACPAGNYEFDSLKIEADGSVVVGTLDRAGLTRFTPDGRFAEFTPLADRLTTNLSFGGADRRTCFVTLSLRGQLAALDWPRPGMVPHYSV
jgi:gluconolactonase